MNDVIKLTSWEWTLGHVIARKRFSGPFRILRDVSHPSFRLLSWAMHFLIPCNSQSRLHISIHISYLCFFSSLESICTSFSNQQAIPLVSPILNKATPEGLFCWKTSLLNFPALGSWHFPLNYYETHTSFRSTQDCISHTLVIKTFSI